MYIVDRIRFYFIHRSIVGKCYVCIYRSDNFILLSFSFCFLSVRGERQSFAQFISDRYDTWIGTCSCSDLRRWCQGQRLIPCMMVKNLFELSRGSVVLYRYPTYAIMIRLHSKNSTKLIAKIWTWSHKVTNVTTSDISGGGSYSVAKTFLWWEWNWLYSTYIGIWNLLHSKNNLQTILI